MEQNTAYRVIIRYAARVAALLFLVIAVLYLASEVLLLVFAGILVAIFLSALAQWVQGMTKVSYRGSLGVVLLSILALLWASGYFAAPSIGRQMDELADRLPRSIERLEKQINDYPWGRRLLSETKDKEALGDPKSIFSHATGAISITLGFVASLVIVLFIGVYAAVEPMTYRRGCYAGSPFPASEICAR